jgi:hypothetical protein
MGQLSEGSDVHAVDENGEVREDVAVKHRRVAGRIGVVAAQNVTNLSAFAGMHTGWCGSLFAREG